MGDVLHSRVARSNAELWTLLGGEVVLCGPKTLLPADLASKNVTLTHHKEEAAEGAHAVMALRLQKERMNAGLLPSLTEYRKRYGVDEQLMTHAHPNALVMHPGPMNRDVEISGTLADSTGSVIEQQVQNGVPIRMAVLYTLLVGKK